jgi:hypothetical protein
VTRDNHGWPQALKTMVDGVVISNVEMYTGKDHVKSLSCNSVPACACSCPIG